MTRRDTILLLGPTGSGKTPLGELLESQGLWDRRCTHFDFGENLRRIAGDNTGLLGPEELDVVINSLETGALLEDEHFTIARKILRAFLDERNVGADDFVILNGLPRHTGQAGDVDSILNIQAIIYLSCTPEIVFNRIASNAGGDRTERIDDNIESIKRKLDIFTKRTAPLLEHYRRRGARIESVEIAATTTPEDVREMLDNRKKGTWD
ncbi:MAG: nucleoside monophosphate kinase [Phycisphaerae bacterium]|nr:nucleoside monophosphate kinase [Phycisphaerae bacterium]